MEESEDIQQAAVDEFGREIKKGGKRADTNKGRVRAYMLYLREGRHDSITVADGVSRPSKYLRYEAPIADVLPGQDSLAGDDGYCSDLVVWPEIWTKYIDALQPDANSSRNGLYNGNNRQKYQAAIWWLSVDNNRGAFSPKDFKERCDVLHLVQSHYARQYVTSHIAGKQRQMNGQAKVLDLTEFIPYASECTAAVGETSTAAAVEPEAQKVSKQSTRDLDVVYNPLKGMHYTDEIIRRSRTKRARTADGSSAATSDIQFTPIGGGEGARERISGEEVVALLKRAKVVSGIG